MPRYEYLVEITERPVPEELGPVYHYFRDRKRALRFASTIGLTNNLHHLEGGATFLKPVAFPVFFHAGKFYQMRMEFPYEDTAAKVTRCFRDENGDFGCDCSRSDILSFAPEFSGKKFQHGNSIRLESLMIDFENDPTDYRVH